MRLFDKTKGAISLFLVIILVPMMTLSGLFVDASKVNLGRAMAESAGDLTLNTALTNYDTDLKELYGLMATAQNTDDLFGKLEDYYRTCITSSGVGEAEAETYVGQIMAQLGVVAESNDTADIMNMELVDFAVEKYPDANLANATILEKQIVDFMKYRAPINTGMSFISSLKSFSTLSKQTELVEKKQVYYEAQQGVMECLRDAWADIAQYNATNIVQTAEYLNEIEKELQNAKDGGDSGSFLNYKQLHEWMVKDLYHVSPAIHYQVSVTAKGNKSYDVKVNGVDQYDLKEEYAGITLPSVTNIENAVTKLKHAIEVVQGTFEANKALFLVSGDPYYDLQHLVQKNRVSDDVLKVYTNQMLEVYTWYSTVEFLYNSLPNLDAKRAEIQTSIDTNTTQKTSAEADLASAEAELAKLQNAGSDTDEDEEDTTAEKIEQLKSQITTLKTTITTLTNTISELETERDEIPTTDAVKGTNITVDGEQQTVTNWVNAIGSVYDTEMSDHFAKTASNFTTISNLQSVEYNKNLEYTKTTLSDISTTINTYLTDLEAAHTHLDNASKDLGEAVKKLEGDVATAKQNWEMVANDSTIKDTSLAQQDKAELAQLDTYLTVNNVNKLKTRLEHVRDKLKEAIDQLKNYKYCGTFIGEISTFELMEIAIEGKLTKDALESVPIKMVDLQTKSDGWWAQCWQDGGLKMDWVDDSGYQPDLVKDKCSMYSYLYTHFAGTENVDGTEKRPTETKPETKDDESSVNTETADTDNGETLYENIKESGKKGADGVEKKEDEAAQAGKDAKNISGNSLPSTKAESTDNVKEAEKVTDVDNAAKKSSASLGGLFSKDFLDAVAGMATDLRDKLYVADYAMSMFTYDTIENEYKKKNDVEKVESGMLLSLTKNDLSKANNYAYGAEVEYIIYGGTNSSNLGKAYGTIYGIRFGFNVIYAFATSEIRDSALAIATPISAATLGIIPVPLIQAAIIIALACCESALDLAYIRDGEQIPLYKSKDTWVCSVSGLTNAAKEKVASEVKKQANALVDEGLNKINALLDMTDEELTATVNGKTDDIVATMEKKYDQLITENANMVIQRLTMLVNTAVEQTMCSGTEMVATTYADMKEQALANVKSELKKWGEAQTGDDIASVVRREATNVILNNCDTVINKLFEETEKAVLNSEPGQTINTILNAPQHAEEGVAALGGTVMECVNKIRMEIESKIVKGSEKVLAYKDQMKTKIETAAKAGADDLKKALNEYVDGFCGETSGGDEGTTTASFCSFAYSDYIRLFTLISLYVNEERTVLRIADVIQTNIEKCKNRKDYELEKSAVYVKVSAEIQVKPTFLALPLFADVENNPNSDSNWYTIQYNGMAGY